MIADFDKAHRPGLTADDRAALREYSDMGWTVGGRWISLGQILDAWTDAAMRAHYSASGRADALAARVAELEESASCLRATANEYLRDYESALAREAQAQKSVAELERSLTTARSLLADFRRPVLPDGAARAVEMAADAFLAGVPVERTLSDDLAQLEELKVQNEQLSRANLEAIRAGWLPSAVEAQP